MSGNHADDIDKRVRGYLLIGASLLVLTGITVAVAWADLPVKTGIAVALFIAAFKGSLVAGYFMHLIDERKMIYGVLGITVAFFVALLLLPIFTDLNHLGY